MADVPATIHQEFTLHFVETMDEVLKIALERPVDPLTTAATETPIRAEFVPGESPDQDSVTH
jgi:hypothetical protein